MESTRGPRNIVLLSDGTGNSSAKLMKTNVWRAGFSSGRHPIFVASLPFRRVLTVRWFVPIVRVGDHLAEYHRTNQIEEVPMSAADAALPPHQRRRKVRGFAEFTPTFTGPMFLFVNDAVLPFGWEALYGNNKGSAKVTIAGIEPDPAR